MTDQLFTTGTQWKISYTCAVTQLDCTFHGITRDGGCGGACCKTMSYWPPKAGTNTAHCDNLGPTGCILGDGKPITCHFYPWRLNKHGTWVLSHTGFYLGNTCAPCKHRGPRAIDVILPSLRVLLGPIDAQRVIAQIDEGRDAIIDVPSTVKEAWDEEHAWEADNIVPLPRDYAEGQA